MTITAVDDMKVTTVGVLLVDENNVIEKIVIDVADLAGQLAEETVQTGAPTLCTTVRSLGPHL